MGGALQAGAKYKEDHRSHQQRGCVPFVGPLRTYLRMKKDNHEHHLRRAALSFELRCSIFQMAFPCVFFRVHKYLNTSSLKTKYVKTKFTTSCNKCLFLSFVYSRSRTRQKPTPATKKECCKRFTGDWCPSVPPPLSVPRRRRSVPFERVCFASPLEGARRSPPKARPTSAEWRGIRYMGRYMGLK